MKLIFQESKKDEGGITTFVFKPENSVDWKPGQFVHYTLPHENADDRGEERWFTISSAPHEGTVDISTRMAPGVSSSFKTTLSNLKPGDVIEADEPGGSFVIDDLNKNYIFVIGGIGITPIYSLVKQLAHDGKKIQGELLYANRNEDTTPFKTQLEKFADENEKFTITPFYGDSYIDETVLKNTAQKFEDPIYYVSGPEPMVEAFKKTLESMGVDEQHSKFDYFPGYEVNQR